MPCAQQQKFPLSLGEQVKPEQQRSVTYFRRLHLCRTRLSWRAAPPRTCSRRVPSPPGAGFSTAEMKIA